MSSVLKIPNVFNIKANSKYFKFTLAQALSLRDLVEETSCLHRCHLRFRAYFVTTNASTSPKRLVVVVQYFVDINVQPLILFNFIDFIEFIVLDISTCC